MKSPRPRQLVVASSVTALGLFAASPALAGTERIRAEGPLVAYSPAVPAGAHARVQAVANAAGTTIVTLQVRGLRPNTEYGAHAHQNACGATGAAAGAHYQRVMDPVQPSTNPAYANPRNEIWLDFTTDAEGNGSAQTRVRWQFEPDRRAGSVIVHEHATNHGPDGAGTAGARLACLSVGF